MNKDSLIDQVITETGLSKKAAETAVESIFDIITKKLQAGEKVNITGFGAFMVKDRKGRAGVDPQTKKKIQIPTVKVAKFRPGKTLKEAVK